MAEVVAGKGDGNLDGAVGVGGSARSGIVGQEILGAELAVDAIEDGTQLLGRVGIEQSTAGGFGHGFQRVFAGGVAPAFIFHGADDDGVKKRIGADGFLASGVEVGLAGGFACVGDEDDDAAVVVPAAFQRASAEKHGVVNRSAGPSRNPANRRLQIGDVIRKRCNLRHVFIERENGQPVAGPQYLANKMGGAFLLEADLLVGAQAGVDHDRQVQGLRSLGLESVDLLFNALFKELESLPGKVGGGAVFLVKDADKNIDEIDVDADAAALGGGLLGIVPGGRRPGLDDFSGFPLRRRAGGGVGANAGFRLLRPGRAVGLVLGKCTRREKQRWDGHEQLRVGVKGCHRHCELRCRFRARCRRGCRREFTVGPDRAVFEVLLLPDGHSALQGVDGEAASVKGSGTVRSAHDYEYAGFADFEAAEPVGHGDAMDAVFFMELSADFAHLGEGHGLVSFVVQVKGRAVVRLIADETVERDDGAVFGRAHMAGQRGHVDGFAHQLVDVIVGKCRHVDASSAANGREKGNFVAGVERRVPSSKFLVA